MSKENWISLRNAAVRVLDPSNIRSDKIFEEASLWPKIDAKDTRLKEFVAAAIEGKITAMGIFSKASIGKHEHYDRHLNRACIMQRLAEDDKAFKLAIKTDSKIENRFILACDNEDGPSCIQPCSWQNDGQMWERNTLIVHDFAFLAENSSFLTAQPTPEVRAEVVAIQPEKYRYSPSMPEFHMYQRVQIEERSLNNWLEGFDNVDIANEVDNTQTGTSINVYTQACLPLSTNHNSVRNKQQNPEGNIESKSNQKRKRGARRKKDWEPFVDNLNDFLKYLEQDALKDGRRQRFDNINQFFKEYEWYLKRNSKKIGLEKSAITLKQGTFSASIKGYKTVDDEVKNYAHKICYAVLSVVDAEYDIVENPETDYWLPPFV